jgi:hypothetical protein
MIIISGQRGTGKTKELIAYCLDNNSAIACRTPEREREIIEKSICYFNQKVKTILFDQLKDKDENIALDDAWEDFLSLFRKEYGFNGNISAITREV